MIKICRYCGNEFKTSDGSRKFCSRRCSGFCSKHKHTEETKRKISDSLKAWCDQHQKVKEKCKSCDESKQKCKSKYCKSCGELKEKCKHPDLCNHYIIRKKSKILEKLGFDFSKLGTISIYEEYDRIYRYIFEEYYIKKKSLKDICNLHGLTCETSLCKIMDMYKMNRRKFSESSHIAFLQGKIHFNNNMNSHFRHGIHITWDNNQVYYRSSYELDYCKYLDNLKIHYDMEKLKICYLDTQKNKYRVAVPDFYIPSKNLIVEIKGDFTYDKQNMIDKFRSYKRNGYDYKLILEGKDFCKKLPENKIKNINKYFDT